MYIKISVILLFLVGCFVSGLCKEYKVYFMTGYHGPASRAQFRIIGEKGQTLSHVISPNGGEFRAFSKNIFTIDDKDVGKVTAVKVYFKSGMDWHIRKVIVRAGRFYTFSYNDVVLPGKWTTIAVKCTKGYKTGSDGRCIDIDECRTTNPCKDSLAKCYNTIGSYQCICPPGYTEASGYCRDKNECLFGKPCIQGYCVNTPGSYRCKCNRGYEIDEGKCVDVDECKDGIDNCDRASTLCYNYEGGFNCRCKPGYKWVSNSKTRCELVICSAQKPDSLTTYSPARCLKENANKEGDVCTRGCVYGYELSDMRNYKTIQCQDGKWRGITSAPKYCIGRKCPALPQIQNVRYDPSDCGVNGGRYKGRPCEQDCTDGYKKVKGDSRECQIDGTWNGTPATCIRNWPDPTISCPAGIIVTLQPGKNTASAGSQWKFPYSNYNNFTTSPAGANGQYQFPAGITKLRWTVTNPDGKTATCSQRVTVLDQEPPKIVSCPAPTVFLPAYTKGPYHVTYKEPEFSDNVGVVRVEKNNVKKTYDATGIFYQDFTAYDRAGKSVQCKFAVEIGGTKCTTWPDDRGFPGTWFSPGSSFGQTFASRTCPAGKTTYPASESGYYTCDKATGKWYPDVASDCVDFKTVKKEDQCASGYEKKFSFNTYTCGTYLKEGNCTMCAAGTYQNQRGQTTCNKCPSGTSSAQGDFACRDHCPAGTFSKDGMRPFCTLCPQGQYQDQQGQTSCNVCPQNKFTNTKLGATSCQDVKPSHQQQNGLLEISSIKKPKEWDIHNNGNTLECNIKDNNFKLVSVKWKIINKDNIPVDFLGKPKFEEIRNNSGKVIGSRLVLSQISNHNARLEYVCVATNVNGETRKSETIPWPY